MVRTPLFEQAAAQDPELLAAVTSMHPIGRLGQPDEIAAAVVWLCSARRRSSPDIHWPSTAARWRNE